METPAPLARILEPHCIGCTLCILACPEEAIVGARRLMHTVIAQRCTGCGLCLPPCPVDCIELLPAATRSPAQAREGGAGRERGLERSPAPSARRAPYVGSPEHRRAAVQAALERARARRR
jgi:electron transport complex protein RnfB